VELDHTQPVKFRRDHIYDWALLPLVGDEDLDKWVEFYNTIVDRRSTPMKCVELDGSLWLSVQLPSAPDGAPDDVAHALEEASSFIPEANDRYRSQWLPVLRHLDAREHAVNEWWSAPARR
jgi:hypothetical protein